MAVEISGLVRAETGIADFLIVKLGVADVPVITFLMRARPGSPVVDLRPAYGARSPALHPK
jgi:hypothetical protein